MFDAAVGAPVPFDAEMDRDLGIDVNPQQEVRRAVDQASLRDMEDDATDQVGKICKIIDFKALTPTLEKEMDWEEFKFKMKVIASVLGVEREMDLAEGWQRDDVFENDLTIKMRAVSRVLYMLLGKYTGVVHDT